MNIGSIIDQTIGRIPVVGEYIDPFAQLATAPFQMGTNILNSLFSGLTGTTQSTSSIFSGNTLDLIIFGVIGVVAFKFLR
jgi:hypothetical protein